MNVFDSPIAPTPEGWALPPNYFEELDIALRRQAQKVVDAAIQTLKANPDYTVDGAIACGPPRVIILEEAETWGADLIVIGSHGYSGLKRFLLGSVSHAVVSHAKCSVEVVRSNGV